MVTGMHSDFMLSEDTSLMGEEYFTKESR